MRHRSGVYADLQLYLPAHLLTSFARFICLIRLPAHLLTVQFIPLSGLIMPAPRPISSGRITL